MPVVPNIPEAPALRRLAAALSSSLASSVSQNHSARDDLNQSVRTYFHYFPWTGERIARGAQMPTLAEATVGQYFQAFDWDGLQYRSATIAQAKTLNTKHEPSGRNGSQGKPPEQNFLTSFFGD